MARIARRFIALTLAVVLLVAIGFGAALWWMRPQLVDEEVRRLVVTTIQREAPASFYVTGTLDLMTTTTVENTKYFLPDLLRLNLGTTRATVRLPGRISYGFDVRRLRAEAIRIREDGIIEVVLPELQVYSVEPDLEKMDVQTSVGWARMHARSGQRVEQQAMQHVQEAMRNQGMQHLKNSTQPRIHTAQAMQKLLTPVLQAAGVEDPQFRFQIGPQIVMEGAG